MSSTSNIVAPKQKQNTTDFAEHYKTHCDSLPLITFGKETNVNLAGQRIFSFLCYRSRIGQTSNLWTIRKKAFVGDKTARKELTQLESLGLCTQAEGQYLACEPDGIPWIHTFQNDKAAHWSDCLRNHRLYLPSKAEIPTADSKPQEFNARGGFQSTSFAARCFDSRPMAFAFDDMDEYQRALDAWQRPLERPQVKRRNFGLGHAHLFSLMVNLGDSLTNYKQTALASMLRVPPQSLRRWLADLVRLQLVAKEPLRLLAPQDQHAKWFVPKPAKKPKKEKKTTPKRFREFAKFSNAESMAEWMSGTGIPRGDCVRYAKRATELEMPWAEFQKQLGEMELVAKKNYAKNPRYPAHPGKLIEQWLYGQKTPAEELGISSEHYGKLTSNGKTVVATAV